MNRSVSMSRELACRLCLVISCLLLLLPGALPADAGEPHLAWSKLTAGGLDIYYRAPGSSAERVTADAAADITPALCRDGTGHLRLFWVRRSGKEQHLYTSIRDKSGWGGPERVPTGSMPVSHPTALAGGSGTLIVAWTGFDGTDDDIFVMTRAGGVWGSPVKAGGRDGVPDIHPVLGHDDSGVPWLYWQGFDGQAYRGYAARLEGGRWLPADFPAGEDRYRPLLLGHLAAADPGGIPEGAEGVTAFFEGEKTPLLPFRLREILR